MEYLLGIVVSLLVEGVKKAFGTSGTRTMLVMLLISLVGATAYYFAVQTVWWNTAVKIILMASAFHNILLRNLNPQNT